MKKIARKGCRYQRNAYLCKWRIKTIVYTSRFIR